ncbi:MAG: hypothetical protein ACTSPP_11285 [Candidatus Heimdallarchaeaceae archaeon]
MFGQREKDKKKKKKEIDYIHLTRNEKIKKIIIFIIKSGLGTIGTIVVISVILYLRRPRSYSSFF